MSDHFSQQDLDAIKERLQKDSLPKAIEFIINKLQGWKSVSLRVALVGESAVGKSTFINSVRGLIADDEGAAAVGTGDTTQEPTPYPYSDNDKIVFWDLPGVGTVKFPREEYLSKFDLRKYDFFIIVGEVFTGNDAWLAQEIRRQGKDFFCVRTKIDQALYSAKRDRGRNYDENQVIQDIKKKCTANLQVDMAKVYVVDNYDKEGWDFPRLLDDILASLPEQQSLALLLTLGPLTKRVIQMKADALRQRVWKVATLAAVVSGAATAIPLAGGAVSAAVDISVLVIEVMFYIQQFALTPEALEHTAEQHRIPLECLARVLQTATISGMTKSAVAALIRLVLSTATETVVSRAVISTFLPFIGPFITGILSYKSVVYVLNIIIDRLREDAGRVADLVLGQKAKRA